MEEERAYGSVSEQKTWNDGERQPMGCGGVGRATVAGGCWCVFECV